MSHPSSTDRQSSLSGKGSSGPNTAPSENAPAPSESAGARLVARGIDVGYRNTNVISDLTLEIPEHAVTTIVGPNGCGKSTLLHTLARLLAPRAGAVELNGRDLYTLAPKQAAQTIGLLPQSPVAPEGMTVSELVALGRHPHHTWIRPWSVDDADHVRRALELTSVSDLAERPLESLSGGQRQRVWLAMTLAQDTEILLLDEPTTYLDLAHALDLLDLVDTLHEDRGRTVVMVLHDLVLATRYSDHLVVMNRGKIEAAGHPAEVVTEELLAEVFGLSARVIEDPVSDRPLIVPFGRRHTSVTNR
ncbi:ABC transporter ATP-binding protein [Kocuria sp.]|uniref:ABC transporter ATP-binding protein n=1 Tax=Kocuria sp. TaxID=1871328 RepID=UPI0026DF5FF0|nr:ABC transporter ATP-binding protein [Kocuria sp.]MDO5618416.1 ABC transporter ATP-binding protein [Kocuria sp.]